MSKHPQYDKVWTEKPDEQLFDALAHTDNYEPEAIEALQQEIARRHLDTQRVAELEATAANTKGEEAAKAELPLQWPMRILMLLLSFGIAQVILGEHYRNRGYTRRSREVWIWMVYGLLFWFAIVILRRL